METRRNIMTVERNLVSNWARKTFRSSGCFKLATFKVIDVNAPEVVNNADSLFCKVSPKTNLQHSLKLRKLVYVFQ